jgi:hypothetical protein
MVWVILGVVIGLWVLMNMKTSRGDGTFQRNVHPYRKLMQYIMPTRNESVVYFDDYIDAEKLQQYVNDAREKFDVTITQCVVAAAAVVYYENPGMRQFISGRRLYHRNGVWLTFSVKRTKGDKTSGLSAVKMEMLEGETFKDLCDRISEKINVERSGKKTYADKEFDIFNLLPRPVMMAATKFFRWLDFYNLLPYEAFIKKDGMYTNMFIANLGSLGMNPGYHHLYEWGNCSHFMMVGRINDVPVVRDGKVVVRPILHVRYSYDERIDDGLTARYGIECMSRVLENPYEELGCLADDGSDAKPLSSTKDEGK